MQAPFLFWKNGAPIFRKKINSYDHEMILFYVAEIFGTDVVHDATTCCQWIEGAQNHIRL